MPELPRDIRAVLFDIYGTLLDGPRYGDRNERITAVAGRYGLAPESDCAVAFDRAVAEAHQASADPFPEVDVREIWSEIFPELREPDAFALEAEEAIHPVSVVEAGHQLLRTAIERELAVGIVSNAQTYTRVLMARHFPDLWTRVREDLVAFSYEHRISKPDLRLFGNPLASLTGEGIRPHEILMVGDSAEHDIVPARSLGLRTHLIRA